MSDLPGFMSRDEDDVVLDGVAVTNVEQADDVLLLSLSREGLRRKVEGISRWCSVNFMLFNETKSVVMVFGGKAGDRVPLVFGEGCQLQVVTEVSYLGFLVTSSGSSGPLRKHYNVKAQKAKRITGTMRGVEKLTGLLPVPCARKLYMALVDPHLTHGADVMVDHVERARREQEKEQEQYLRRVLGVGSRCRKCILFTETGLIPLQVRRLSLTVKCILYLLRNPALLASAAYRELVSLDFAGHRTWVSRLREAITALPYVVGLLEEINGGVGRWLQGLVDASPDLYFIQGRREPDARGDLAVAAPVALRQYLRVSHPGYRRALTRVLLGEHRYAVRRRGWGQARDRCLCRFCGRVTETVEHLWLVCGRSEVLAAGRRRFMVDIWKAASLEERAELQGLNDDARSQLKVILSSRRWVTISARFAYEIERLLKDSE
ncbi:hypothetical protein DFP72DRAFT_817439 [Ephemerocybe angulata]|uniref:Reverse transcriptase n=1 Tax=Ephemerocybe angulata TaxID=980116 RepID=A0A8H6M1A2_9AGAR|nr:hypothetical protein DFP72DRAFT_817439 [Tulosesus angulatus]